MVLFVYDARARQAAQLRLWSRILARRAMASHEIIGHYNPVRQPKSWWMKGDPRAIDRRWRPPSDTGLRLLEAGERAGRGRQSRS